ncbi:MAG: SapC family protein [Gammaproteobacteria bacterium]|nr:SapC family protein [Gammaproteobacteria bacterium]
MTRHVLLNNIDHQNTRVIHHFSSEFGDNLHSALVFPTEFTELQKEYPILLRKDDPQGSYQAIALLGFATAENLYLNDQHATGWDARYIPASIEKGPFLIGFQRSMGMQDQEPNAVVHIDMNHPKVSTEQGQQLFLSQGGNSPYLEHISARLQTIHQGTVVAPLFYKALEQLELVEPVTIEFSLHNSEKIRLLGNYCINEQRLATLPADALAKLQQSGFLALIYAMVFSMGNIRHLIERKNNHMRQHNNL